MRELWSTIAHTSSAKIYSMVVGIFTLSLTAKLLGPVGRGQVAAIATWVGMFSTFAYLSLGQVALHRMTLDRDRIRFGHLLGSLLFMTVVLSAAGWLVAIGMYVANPSAAFKGLPWLPLVISFLALPFMIWEQYGSCMLMGLERIRIYNNYQIIGRTVTVAMVFALVGGLGLGVTGAVAATVVGQVIVAMGGISVLFAFARNNSLSCRPDKQEIQGLLSGGAKLHLNAIGAFLTNSVNILILSHYHGDEKTGHFQMATQLLWILMIIPQAGSMVIYGKVASLGPNMAWPANRRLLLQMTIGIAAVSGIAALLAPWGITLLAGEAFRPAVAPFQWMLLGLVGLTFSAVMAPQWIGRGYFWQAAALTFVVGGVSLAANFAFIPKYGIQGAIYVFLAANAFSVLANGIVALWCESQFTRQALAG